MSYSFSAWDTVVRELQAERDNLAAQRDNIGGMRDCDRYVRIGRLIAMLQREWEGKG